MIAKSLPLAVVKNYILVRKLAVVKPSSMHLNCANMKRLMVYIFNLIIFYWISAFFFLFIIRSLHSSHKWLLDSCLYFVTAKLESSEAICLEPDCLQYFSNEECLKEHIRSCHQHVTCEVCGSKQLKKNMKRHLRGHDTECSSDKIICEFDGCGHTFSTVSL